MPYGEPLTAAKLSEDLLAARAALIEILSNLRTGSGWRELTADLAQDYWSNINVSSALLKAGDAREAAADSVYQSIQSRLDELTRYGGLLAEGSRVVPNANLTADAGIFMVRYGDIVTAQRIADHIVERQLPDGAWSIALVDPIPRVRATSQVLRFLFEFRQTSDAEAKDSAIKRGIRWLTVSNVPGTMSWSNIANDRSPNLSATIWVLTALVAAAEHSLLSEVEHKLLDGLVQETLNMGQLRSWIGTREDASVALSNAPSERIGSGAVSLTFFVPAYWSYLCLSQSPLASSESLRIIPKFFENIYDRKEAKSGSHVISISEEGATTFTYNLGFALDAVSTVEKSLGHILVLKQADSIFPPIRPPKADSTWAERPGSKYFSWLGWLGFVTLGLYEILAHSGEIPKWYQHRSPFTQGILMACAGVIIGATGKLAMQGWKFVRHHRIGMKDTREGRVG